VPRAARTAPGKRRTRGTIGVSLIATADRKGGRVAAGETPDHFEKIMEKLCPNHALLVKHLYKVCTLMKKYLSGGTRKGEQKKRPKPAEGEG
jgi:hypothetical protein